MLENPKSFIPHRGKVIKTNGQSAGKTKHLAYLLGVYLGDGWIGMVQGYHRFRLNTIDNDFAETAAESLESINGYRPKINIHPVSKSSKPNHSIAANGKNLSWMVEATERKNKIPSCVWKMDKESKLAFIAGIMDSEGYASKGTQGRLTVGLKACDGWINDFYRFMISMGVTIGKIGEENLPSGKIAKRFHFNIWSWIDAGCYFNIQRKENRIKEWASNPQRLHARHAVTA